MDTEAKEEFDWARGEMAALKERTRSCLLATVSASGEPHCSYAPTWISGRGSLYVYVSALAKHYGNLRRRRLASALLIDDESASEELFARKRLAMDCEAALIARDDPEWEASMARMEDRLGGTLGYLKGLSDFDLFRLDPTEGRLTLGFGKAYRVFGDGLGEIGYVGSGGHRAKSSED